MILQTILSTSKVWDCFPLPTVHDFDKMYVWLLEPFQFLGCLRHRLQPRRPTTAGRGTPRAPCLFNQRPPCLFRGPADRAAPSPRPQGSPRPPLLGPGTPRWPASSQPLDLVQLSKLLAFQAQKLCLDSRALIPVLKAVFIKHHQQVSLQFNQEHICMDYAVVLYLSNQRYSHDITRRFFSDPLRVGFWSWLEMGRPRLYI